MTADIVLSKASQVDLVEEEPYATILEERFIKGKETDYFHGKEGNIGEHYIIQLPTSPTSNKIDIQDSQSDQTRTVP